jgi:hypothetical protein
VSMYSNPEIVRMLMEERIRDARAASLVGAPRRASASGAGPVEFVRRIFARRHTSAPAACSC